MAGAKPGPKPKPPGLRGIQGGKKSDSTENPAAPERRTTPLVPPKKLSKRQQQVWDEHVEPAWWLNQNDVPLAFQWTCMYAYYIDNVNSVIASELAEMRKAYHQLALSSAEQVRMGIEQSSGESGRRFFDRGKRGGTSA